MKRIDINIKVNKYISETHSISRWTSYDYCYNYFNQNKGKSLTYDIEKSCLVLGFYLASWGMFRGKSYLSQNSLFIYKPIIEYISELNNSYWKIDVDNYDNATIEAIEEVYLEVRKRLIPKENTHLTVVTKVLLGVFGFIPAYDSNFCKGFREIYYGCEGAGFRTLNKKNLLLIKDFYDSNKNEIDMFHNNLLTTDFITGQKTSIKYTKAKIIDMYGFECGKEL
jgi:hypothetical protein